MTQSGEHDKPGQRGLFLCLDGIDGAGKTTQIALLRDWLIARGESVLVCRDPGGTAVGDEIRKILLGTHHSMSMRCEMLLYQASRAQLVDEVIEPALAARQTVLCDRFLLSTIVYQGYGGGIPVDAIRKAAEIATRGILPNWTGVLDISPATAVARRKEPADRIESRSEDFYRRVRDGFLAEAKSFPDRITIIDGESPMEQVKSRIEEEVTRVLARAGRS